MAGSMFDDHYFDIIKTAVGSFEPRHYKDVIHVCVDADGEVHFQEINTLNRNTKVVCKHCNEVIAAPIWNDNILENKSFHDLFELNHFRKKLDSYIFADDAKKEEKKIEIDEFAKPLMVLSAISCGIVLLLAIAAILS